MDLPAIQLLCLEQEVHSLKDHTRKFLDLACHINFLDGSLCVYYYFSLQERSKERLPIFKLSFTLIFSIIVTNLIGKVLKKYYGC